MKYLFAAAALVAAFSCAALARDNKQWDATDADVRQWYRTLMQPDVPISCCGEADAYWADSFEVEGDHYVAIITDDRDIPGRPPIPSGTRVLVPNNKMKFDAGNPTGHGVLFVAPWKEGPHVYCYISPGGV